MTQPNMGKNAALSNNSIQMYQVTTPVNQKDLLGQCKSFFQRSESKVKGQGHHIH